MNQTKRIEEMRVRLAAVIEGLLDLELFAGDLIEDPDRADSEPLGEVVKRVRHLVSVAQGTNT